MENSDQRALLFCHSIYSLPDVSSHFKALQIDETEHIAFHVTLIISGYILSYKREFEEWQEVPIDPDRETFTLDSLKCGSSYQLYLTAINEVGNGKPSAIISAKTEGSRKST